MLKTFRGLVLGLVVLVGSACVTPTHASSTSQILLTHIQAGSATSALDEIIVMYNNGPNPQDISEWCFTNKTGVYFACFNFGGPNLSLILPAYRYAVMVSDSVATTMEHSQYTASFEPTHGGYGSLTAGSDELTLVDSRLEPIDAHSWGSSLAGGSHLFRIAIGDGLSKYVDTDAQTDWIKSTTLLRPFANGAEVVQAPELTDACNNIEELQVIPPQGFVYLSDGSCVDRLSLLEEPQEEGDTENQNPDGSPGDYPIHISEILPNITGSDAGGEFVELYNTSAVVVNLSGYEILMGKSLEKSVMLPEIQVEPGEYVALYNDTLSFSLLNTENRVALRYAGVTFSELAYSNPKDDMAWALIDGVWQYTNRPTPNKANLVTVEDNLSGEATQESTLKPCASNQYRSPETNRCRLIETSSTSLKPCQPGQERNPDTNRCRSTEAATKTQTACKEGYERNAETNRCRKIVKMTETDYSVLGVQDETDGGSGWYVWVAGGVALIAGLGYAAWEWRRELKGLIIRAREKFGRGEI